MDLDLVPIANNFSKKKRNLVFIFSLNEKYQRKSSLAQTPNNPRKLQPLTRAVIVAAVVKRNNAHGKGNERFKNTLKKRVTNMSYTEK